MTNSSYSTIPVIMKPYETGINGPLKKGEWLANSSGRIYYALSENSAVDVIGVALNAHIADGAHAKFHINENQATHKTDGIRIALKQGDAVISNTINIIDSSPSDNTTNATANGVYYLTFAASFSLGLKKEGIVASSADGSNSVINPVPVKYGGTNATSLTGSRILATNAAGTTVSGAYTYSVNAGTDSSIYSGGLVDKKITDLNTALSASIATVASNLASHVNNHIAATSNSWSYAHFAFEYGAATVKTAGLPLLSTSGNLVPSAGTINNIVQSVHDGIVQSFSVLLPEEVANTNTGNGSQRICALSCAAGQGRGSLKIRLTETWKTYDATGDGIWAESKYWNCWLRTWTSDRRLKQDIIPTAVTNALDVVNKIEHYSFAYRSEPDKTYGNGYIAQQLLELNEDFVVAVPQEDETEIYQVDEAYLIPYITKAIQEFHADYEEKISTLEEENEDLQAEVHSLGEKLETLEGKYNDLYNVVLQLLK